MSSVQYLAPASLEEASRALADSDNARVLAGGTDLLVQMRLGLKDPALVVDIKRIPELTSMTLDDSGLHLGAAVPGHRVTGNSQLAALYPGFLEALGLIGSSQIQGRCSAGGNLCNASPAADSVPAMITNRAVCRVSGTTGERTVPVEEFTTGPGSSCLGPGEFLVSIDFPRPAPRSSDAYLRFIPRTEMDIAVAGAAVALSLDENGVCSAARVAIGAVAPTALLVPEAAEALLGSTLDEASLEQAASAASDAARPITDKRGTAAFRARVVGVLVRRAALVAKNRIETAS